MKTKVRLFEITPKAAKKLFPKAFEKAMVDMDDVDPGELSWYVDDAGNLWGDDSLESHGWTFFCLSAKKADRDIRNVERV